MGRLSRQYIDHFPFDVYFDQDDKIKLIESEYGNQATVVYIKLLARIYREKGWWKKWDEDTEILFARDINETASYVKEVIFGCLRRGLFDQSVFEVFGVLTSRSIQERYIDIVNRLGRKNVVIVLEYWLFDTDLEDYNRVSPDFINVSSDEKLKTSGRNDHKVRKVNKGKEGKKQNARGGPDNSNNTTPGIEPFEDPELEEQYQRFRDYMAKDKGRHVGIYQEQEQREYLRQQNKPIAVIKNTISRGWMSLIPPEESKSKTYGKRDTPDPDKIKKQLDRLNYES